MCSILPQNAFTIAPRWIVERAKKETTEAWNKYECITILHGSGIRWRHGRHLESVTSNRKSHSNRCLFTQISPRSDLKSPSHTVLKSAAPTTRKFYYFPSNRIMFRYT